MSAEFPINFRLNAQDTASTALGSIIGVLKEGRGASEATRQSFAAFRNEILYQNTALRTLNTTYRVQYFELLLVGRAMSSIGAVGHTLLGIVNAVNIAMLTNIGVASDLSKANDNVADAAMAARQALITFGKDSPQYLEAAGKLTAAQNDQKDAIEKGNAALTSQKLLWISVGLSGLGAIGQISLAIPGLIKALGFLGGGSVAVGGVLVGIALVGGALFGLTGYFAQVALEGGNVKDAYDAFVASINTGFAPLDFVIKVIATLAAGFVVLGKQFIGIIASHLTLTPIIEALGKAWKTMGDIASSVWGAIGPLVKTSLNIVIGFVNTFISAIDNMINAYNDIASKIFLPTLPTIPQIPTLAEGGIVTEPTLALIGERGPEAVVPLDRGGGVGGGINVNVWVYGSVVTENQLTNDIARNMYLMLTRIARR